MQYFETLPSLALRPFIKRFWSLEQTAADALNSREPVLPDGCFEIVFNLSDRFWRFDSQERFDLQPQTLVAGQMTRRIVIGPSGNVKLFGIRFQPVGAHGFFGFPMCDLTDRIESLDSLMRVGGDEIEEKLWNASSFRERISIIESLMPQRNCDGSDVKLDKAVDAVAAHRGRVSVSRLAASLGWSERKLERDFKTFVGVSPKTFARINRFSGVVRALETTGPSKLLDHAHEFGYYDQSHMINEFRGFAGESPTAFYDRSHRLSELFTVGK